MKLFIVLIYVQNCVNKPDTLLAWESFINSILNKKYFKYFRPF